MRRALFSAGLAVLLLAGCSTEREYSVPHDRMVAATVDAICDEANVKPGDVKREEIDEKGGHVTVLSAPYKRESRIECKVDSREKNATQPALEVRIVSNEKLFTRHKEWEWRIHEVVQRKLTARAHREESEPTAMPKLEPKVPPPEPSNKIDLKTEPSGK
jgi:hypothetical protein